MSTEPLLCEWSGTGFEPLARHRKAVDARYIIGERYVLAVEEIRSAVAHRSFFASVNEAWRSLPEDQAERFPNPDALRKFALIQAGFCTRREIVCANNREAIRLASAVKEMDSYSLTIVSERAVAIMSAESQSYKSMGKQRFGESQQAVREFCAKLLDVAPDSLPGEEAA